MSSISSGNFSQIAGSYADTAAVYSKSETTKTDETSGKKKVSGQTIGNPKLSEKASKYYEQLKKKYSNMNFILVSEDQKENAKANAAGYANSNNMVVLIDEDKIERMASDENYRKQYEGIIANAASGISQLASSLSATGTSVKGFGMQVNDNGTASYFAVLEKSSAAQKERIEKKAAEKKEAKKAAEKKAEKKEYSVFKAFRNDKIYKQYGREKKQKKSQPRENHISRLISVRRFRKNFRPLQELWRHLQELHRICSLRHCLSFRIHSWQALLRHRNLHRHSLLLLECTLHNCRSDISLR